MIDEIIDGNSSSLFISFSIATYVKRIISAIIEAVIIYSHLDNAHAQVCKYFRGFQEVINKMASGIIFSLE